MINRVRKWLRSGVGFAVLALGLFALFGQVPAVAEDETGDPKSADECPDGSGGRYCDNHDGTVTDRGTGLLWLKDASCDELGPNLDGSATFDAARGYVNALADGRCGLRDGSQAGQWRLPSPREWRGIMDRRYYNPAIENARGDGKWRRGDLFEDIHSDGYWTDAEVKGDAEYAWSAGLFGGTIAAAAKNIQAYIWAVRNP